MKSLFSPEAQTEILDRLETLTPNSEPQWGSMDVAQMLKHVKTTLKIATGEVSLRTPPWYKKLLFSLMKSTLYNDKPWKKNLPTARKLKMTQPEDFAKEKMELKATIDDFLQLSFPDGKKTHPIFGTFTKEQWGKMQYKHLNHHFTQFGA